MPAAVLSLPGPITTAGDLTDCNANGVDDAIDILATAPLDPGVEHWRCEGREVRR